MQKTIKIILTILALSSILMDPVNAQTKEIGIYRVWTDQIQYDPGQAVTVTLELGWDFPSETDISPGVFDVLADEYVADDIYTVANTGEDNVTLSFTAPSVNGVYEYIVNVFYDDEGWTMSETGYEAHTVYVQVGDTGSGVYAAWVTNVDAPGAVKPGELFNVTVYIDVSFPSMTSFSVAVTDPGTGEAINEVEDQTEGDQSGVYWFEIYAPEEEGDYTLGADIVYETPSGWTYTEDGAQTFDITVKATTGVGGIPGFPVASLILGAFIAAVFAYRKPKF